MKELRGTALLKDYSIGFEHELADVDRTTELPMSMTWSGTEKDIVNSDGRAIDPTGKLHTIGGEVNTPPSYDFESQVLYMEELNKLLPEATVNHRHHTHCHVSFDGLREDVESQKKILRYARDNTVDLLDNVFRPTRHEDMNRTAWSYQIVDCSVMPDWRSDFCEEAKDHNEFKVAHQMMKDRKILPQFTKRYSVNLFSCYKHGTVEFRCFFPTLDPEEIRGISELCVLFVNEALSDNPRPLSEAVEEMGGWDSFNIPKECEYSNDMEMGWQATRKQ